MRGIRTEPPLKENARHAADNGTIPERPNPRDVKYERIANQFWDRVEHQDPGRETVLFAWRERVKANRLLRKALWRWFRGLSCIFLMHAPDRQNHPYTGATYCKRCGAWRGDW